MKTGKVKEVLPPSSLHRTAMISTKFRIEERFFGIEWEIPGRNSNFQDIKYNSRTIPGVQGLLGLTVEF